MSRYPRRVRASSAVLPTDGRRQNLSLVLQTLRRLGPTSRAQLAREVGVTKVTMSDLVTQLMEEGHVHDVGPAEMAGAGRRATLVDLDRARLLTLAVDLSVPATLKAAVLDITGEVVTLEERPAAVDAASGRGLDLAVVLDLVHATIGRAPGPVLGVGIGTPGLVDRHGTVRAAPNLGWTDVPLRELVAQATGLPVLVCNDSDAATQAELSASPGSEDMVLVLVGRGVGCGIVTGGRRVAGAHHAAGEIGHVTVGTDGGELCPCGKRGCLETWLSVPRLRAALGAPDAGQGRQVVQAGGERLGVALAPLVPVLERTLSARLLEDPEHPLSVRLAGSPQDIVLRGAAALVLWDRLGVV